MHVLGPSLLLHVVDAPDQLPRIAVPVFAAGLELLFKGPGELRRHRNHPRLPVLVHAPLTSICMPI